ncbi:hypothetical protein J3A83DRAFT_4186196 [Scleroderma citrinum]
MVAWKDTKGKLMAGMHDFNDELGDGMAFPEWESIQDKWSTYATDVFDTKEMVDCEEINEGVGRNRRVQKGKKRPSVPLPTLEDGQASGKVTASVPWMSIREDPKGYIESKYFPVGVSFKEPTKLTHAQITKILEFWHKRQWSKPQDIFRFRWWKDSKGTLQMPVLENKSWSEKILGKRQQKENNMMEMDSPVQSDTKEPVLLVRKKCWTAENGQDKSEPKNPVRLAPPKPWPHAKLTDIVDGTWARPPCQKTPFPRITDNVGWSSINTTISGGSIPGRQSKVKPTANSQGYNDSKRQPVTEPALANPVWQSTQEKWAPLCADDDFAAPLTKWQYK